MEDKIKKFINREDEIAQIKKEIEKSKGSLIILYGRRRIGKTAILNKLYQENVIDLIVTLEDTDYNTNLWKTAEIVSKKYGFPSYSPKSFKKIFEDLPPKSVIALDEFSYLDNFYEFQEIVDNIIKQKKITLILCGSLIRIMEDLSYSYSSPLFGRADVIIKVPPLSIKDVLKWYKNLGLEDVLKIYMGVGGIPRYLELVTTPNDIYKQFFYKNGLLLREGKLLLKEMFPKSHIFSKTLFAISDGETKATDIANKVGVKTSEISKYLIILEDHGMIKRIYPFDKPSKKHVRFYIRDKFFGFWHKFIWKWYGELESGYDDLPIKYYKENESSYYGMIFEDIAKEILKSIYKSEYVISKWWHKDKEIDLLAVNEQTKELLALEVKWQNLKLRDVKKIIEELYEKLPYVEWHNEERKETLGIFAKKVEKKAKEWLGSEGYKVWDLRDVEKMIKKK